MTSPPEPAPPPAEMADLRDLLGRLRRALAQDDMVELGRLMPLLAGLAAAPGLVQGSGGPAGLRNAVLGLLDEAGQLTGELRDEHGRLAAQLREAGAHRRAGVAYRRAGRL
jgi:hypothetical protein